MIFTNNDRCEQTLTQYVITSNEWERFSVVCYQGISDCQNLGKIENA